jgi:DNA-binding LacI/PurR family transcriptional regulator
VTWYEKGGIETVLGALIDNSVEGIVLISPTEWMPPRFLETIRRHRIPVVSLGGVLLEGVPHVESDYEKDTRELVDGLLDAGYKSFIYLTSWASIHHDEIHSGPRLKRIGGFRAAIEARGGTVSETPSKKNGGLPCGEIFFTPSTTDWADPYQIGELGMRQILARRELPDVVMCANDDWAAGALKACGEEGLRVPEDLAITGNDGTVISGYGYIPLTTTMQPLAEMASKAVDLLRLLIEKKKLPANAMMLKVPGRVAWRKSTRHPADRGGGK